MSKRIKANKQTQLLNNSLKEEADKDLSWIFIILIGLLPLLIRAKAIEFISPGLVSSIVNTGIKVEVFSYYKWIFLLCAAVSVTAILVFKMLAYHYEMRRSYINIPVLFLIFFFLLSFFTSETKGIALIGIFALEFIKFNTFPLFPVFSY